MSKILKFPEGFYWGASTASYQVEGGIKNNDWYQAALNGKVPLADESIDHYNLFEQDFDLAKQLGHSCHRISIEWSRIEPEEGKFDLAEIEHYKKVLKALKDRNIVPFVTFWHFTLPIWFVEKGGFENKDSAKIFARYTKFVFENLNENCYFWSTMNEPMVFAWNGYLNRNWPPFKRSIGTFFKVFNNLVKAHNLTYQEIKKLNIDCSIGVVKHNVCHETDKKPWNIFAAIFIKWFWNFRFLNRTKRHLDHLGLNYYFYNKFGKKETYPKSDMGWELVPRGMYCVLKELKKYNLPVYITETGLADKEDKHRSEYIKGLVEATHRAIADGVDVKGFMYWSLLDNYEWAFGYKEHFGLIEIGEGKERKIRPSAFLYKKICEDNALILE